MLKFAGTYEIMTPESVGADQVTKSGYIGYIGYIARVRRGRPGDNDRAPRRSSRRR